MCEAIAGGYARKKAEGVQVPGCRLNIDPVPHKRHDLLLRRRRPEYGDRLQHASAISPQPREAGSDEVPQPLGWLGSPVQIEPRQLLEVQRQHIPGTFLETVDQLARTKHRHGRLVRKWLQHKSGCVLQPGSAVTDTVDDNHEQPGQIPHLKSVRERVS